MEEKVTSPKGETQDHNCQSCDSALLNITRTQPGLSCSISITATYVHSLVFAILKLKVKTKFKQTHLAAKLGMS